MEFVFDSRRVWFVLNDFEVEQELQCTLPPGFK